MEEQAMVCVKKTHGSGKTAETSKTKLTFTLQYYIIYFM